MKILLLVDLYPPNIGGVEKHVQSLAQNLSSRGHQVTVFTLGQPVSSTNEKGVKVIREEGLFQNIPFLYAKSKKHWHPPSQDWWLTRKIARVVQVEKPDIIHVHGWILYSLLPLIKKFKIPVVSTLHGYGYFCPITNFYRDEKTCDGRGFGKCLGCAKTNYGYLRALAAYWGISANLSKLKAVDRFIAVSNYVKEMHLQQLNLPDSAITAIPNFYNRVDTPVQPGNADLPDKFVLYVGALAPYKGLECLIESFSRLETDAKLVVVGYPYQDYHYPNTDKVRVYKNAPEEFLQEAYRRCSLAVFPSLWPEPCATVVFEAMFFKKAVIASAIGGYPDVILDNETGLLVPPNQVEALSAAIERLLHNPELTVQMGLKGYTRLEQFFTAERVNPRIENLYQELVSRRKV